MDIRKNFSKLDETERQRVIAAIKWMKANGRTGSTAIEPALPLENNVYQKYVNFHSQGGFKKDLKDFTLILPGTTGDILHSIIFDTEESISTSKHLVTKTGLDSFFGEIRSSGGQTTLGGPFNIHSVSGTSSPFTIKLIDSPFDDIKITVIKTGTTSPTLFSFTSVVAASGKKYEIETYEMAHRSPMFLPWHRVFLRLFEKDLQFADKELLNDGKITLPYWDWVNETSWDESSPTSVWHEENFGGFQNANSGKVTGTHFSPGKWKLFDPKKGLGDDLIRRRPDDRGSDPFPTTAVIDNIMEQSDFRGYGRGDGSGTNRRFSGDLEHDVHDKIHGTVGSRGQMTHPLISPQDPIFWLFHCNVDRLWSIWQKKKLIPIYVHLFHAPIISGFFYITPQYPTFGLLPGRRLNDNMEPWASASTVLNIRVKDVLNTRNIIHSALSPGYSYDDELTVSILTT